MELFLNLCWLALLLPAYVLWQQRNSSARSSRASFVFLCTLGCVLVLLFPVISASDDLHAVGQAMEECKRGMRSGSGCAGSDHFLTHTSQPSLAASSYMGVVLERSGIVEVFRAHSVDTVLAGPVAGRAPPKSQTISQ